MTLADLFYLGQPTRWRRLAILCLPLATGIVLAIVGAFGTYIGIALPVRLLHFAANALLIGGLSVIVTVLVRRFLFGGAPYPLWMAIAIAAAVAPPGAWIVQSSLRIWAPHVLPHVSFGELIAQVLIVNLFIGAAAWALQRAPAVGDSLEAKTDILEPAASASAPDSLRSRLPFQLRGAAILSLSAEDHYIRVRTDRGQTLILMNLSDAVVALGAESGVRIHRSHWVARQVAIREGPAGKPGIQVDDTTVLPISRSGRKLLRELDAMEENWSG